MCQQTYFGIVLFDLPKCGAVKIEKFTDTVLALPILLSIWSAGRYIKSVDISTSNVSSPD